MFNLFKKKSSRKVRRFSRTETMKPARLRGFGQHRVMTRHRKRMEDPGWATENVRHTRVPYLISGK